MKELAKQKNQSPKTKSINQSINQSITQDEFFVVLHVHHGRSD